MLTSKQPIPRPIPITMITWLLNQSLIASLHGCETEKYDVDNKNTVERVKFNFKRKNKQISLLSDMFQFKC